MARCGVSVQKSVVLALACLLLAGSGCSYTNKARPTTTPHANSIRSLQTKTALSTSVMQLTSPAFTDKQTLPTAYTCDGAGTNPPLTITSVPEVAASLALIVDDPDAPRSTFVHWVVFNISPATEHILENSVPAAALAGTNSAGKNEFIGACPPNGAHRYFFKLFALDTKLALPAAATAADVTAAMNNHILDQAQLMATYERPKK